MTAFIIAWAVLIIGGILFDSESSAFWLIAIAAVIMIAGGSVGSTAALWAS